MLDAAERAFFLANGYLHVRRALASDHLANMQSEFERVWKAEGSPVSRGKLLKHRAFIDLIEHPAIIERQRALFGSQTQLLQYDLLRQEPGSTFPNRFWHRDFVMAGDRPLAVNAILYFDDMTPDRGPTYVVPGTHVGTDLPPPDSLRESLRGEIPVLAAAGDVVFINGAIWHSGSCNRSQGLRRAAYLYYGYWWLKRYNEHEPLPTEVLINAGRERLELLGVSMPASDLHMYGQPRLSDPIVRREAGSATHKT